MNVKQTLARLGFKPSKQRGQNFLFDQGAVSSILSFAALRPEAAVLEIGPGLGALTAWIAQSQRKFAIVELEETFCKYLQSEIEQLNPDLVFCQDVRKLQPKQLAELMGEETLTVISNVPYSISTDIILWIIENRSVFDSATLLLQREYAERIAADPGSKKYGSLSVYCRQYLDIREGPQVAGSCFHPPANVESLCIKLETLARPRVEVEDEDFFFKVVRACFSQRRKTILNSLSAVFNHIEKTVVKDRLIASSVSPGRRAETLSLEEFAVLSHNLRND